MFICLAMASDPETGASMGELLAALRAVAETTRLRLLVLCAGGELTVSELAQILGQSQPRVSRHLKLLCEAGLSEIIAAAGPQDLLDIGTGTGRMIEILGPRVVHALGIDQSREMLAMARVNLERAGLANSIVRLGDMYQLPLADASFDAVVIHQVLHYSDRPAAAIAEAARVLRPNGVLVVVDFAPHALEFLREDHAHRRLGFADADVDDWCRAAGLDPESARRLPGDPLTVVIWTAHREAAPDQLLATTRPGVPAAARVERVLQG